jgi:hypothetical protein
MQASMLRRVSVLTLIVLGLAGCAAATPGSDNTVASAAPQQRWNPDAPIQQNNLLPNGLRPFRYFYW